MLVLPLDMLLMNAQDVVLTLSSLSEGWQKNFALKASTHQLQAGETMSHTTVGNNNNDRHNDKRPGGRNLSFVPYHSWPNNNDQHNDERQGGHNL